MSEKKWTLDVGLKQHHLAQGKLYLIGSLKSDENIKKCLDIIIDSQDVDAKHCVLDATGSTLCIYDLYSKLGTFLNGKRLQSMFKVYLSSEDAEIRIGEVMGRLCLDGGNKSLEHDSVFLMPTDRAPRSSLSNTSTRLFSSPDVSVMGSSTDDSFNIPETQHIVQRKSIESTNVTNTSGYQLNGDGNHFNDDSFIPETQIGSITKTEGERKTLTLKDADSLMQHSLQQTDEILRMCTQDFNENLFSEDVDDETFTSMVIPNIRHDPVNLIQSPTCESINKDVSKASGCDAEMESLNWSAQTSKAMNNESSQNIQNIERDDVCTPDLFDFPELAEIGMPAVVGATNAKSEDLATKASTTTRASANTLDKIVYNENTDIVDTNNGDGYAEEIDLNPTQVFIPIFKQKETTFVKPAGAVESTELSLSGKENIPHTDSGIEQTQIFPITQDVPVLVKNISISPGAKEVKINNICVSDYSVLPPTQIFSNNLNNSAQNNKSKAQAGENFNSTKLEQNLNSTLVSTVDEEKAKSVASFFEDIENTTEQVESEKKLHWFKKPKQITSSSKSTSSKHPNERISNIHSNSKSEVEEFDLCTPKWISDNFDQLSVERNVNSAKQRILFGSDSEDESVELYKITKKDSKDFEKLLSNVKDAKTPLKFTKIAEDTKIDKPEKKTKVVAKTTDIKISNKDGESSKKIAITEDKNPERQRGSSRASKEIIDKVVTHKSDDEKNSTEKKNKRQNPEIIDKEIDQGGKIASAGEKNRSHNKKADSLRQEANTRTKLRNQNSATQKTSVFSDKNDEQDKKLIDAPAKGFKRLRSRTSIDADKSSSSATSAPSKAKKPRKQLKTKVETNKSSSEEKKESNGRKTDTGRQKEATQTNSTNQKYATKRSASNDTKDKQKKEPVDSAAKRLTRLRSRTSDLDDKPSDAKKSRIELNVKVDSSRKRLTRSSSKAGSQESATSSTHRSGKEKTSREVRGHSKDSHSDNSNPPSKSTQASESTDSDSKKIEKAESYRKLSTVVSSDDETNRLRSTTRTLKVAMTMVEPKLFQHLLDNSPGNWCLANDPTDADVLVMDKGNRTLKFLLAMAKGIPIVTSDWLESLNNTKTVPRGITHFFKDKDFEKRHKFSLFKSLELARKRKIFEGYDFLTTPGILPQPTEMKQIIECAGGKVHIEPPPSTPNQKIYVVSMWNDKKHWHKYRRANGNIRITSSEGVMESVMRQTCLPLDSNVFG